MFCVKKEKMLEEKSNESHLWMIESIQFDDKVSNTFLFLCGKGIQWQPFLLIIVVAITIMQHCLLGSSNANT